MFRSAMKTFLYDAQRIWDVRVMHYINAIGIDIVTVFTRMSERGQWSVVSLLKRTLNRRSTVSWTTDQSSVIFIVAWSVCTSVIQRKNTISRSAVWHHSCYDQLKAYKTAEGRILPCSIGMGYRLEHCSTTVHSEGFIEGSRQRGRVQGRWRDDSWTGDWSGQV